MVAPVLKCRHAYADTCEWRVRGKIVNQVVTLATHRNKVSMGSIKRRLKKDEKTMSI